MPKAIGITANLCTHVLLPARVEASDTLDAAIVRQG